MSFYRLVLCSMPLLLTACGDGWEAHRTTEIFPYGNARTAGSGVVYVRAKMMPEKELVVEPAMEEPKAEAVVPAPALSGDKIFSNEQVKGARAPAPPVEKAPAASAPVDGKAPAAKEPEKHGSAADVLSPASMNAVKAKMASADTKIQAEQLLAQGQKHPQELEVSVSALRAADIEPAAGAVELDGAYEIYPNEVVEPTRLMPMPKNEIVSPKKDYVNVTTEGQRSLDQIYEDSF